jgi:hydrogenase maturation protease
VNSTASDVLVIGYGNPLRGDDGLGPQVADLIAAQNWPGVRTLSVHQLTPELAAELTQARLAVFVDAGVIDSEPAISMSAVAPAEPVARITHQFDPQTLLGLTQALYGVCPPAQLVTIAGRYFEVYDKLSPQAAADALRAVEQIAGLLTAGASSRRPENP